MPELTLVARRLRRTQTEVERLLWSRLRDRKLGGWKFRRQMPIGQHVVDFCCPDGWLVLELDGAQHSTSEGLSRDRSRTATLESGGYLLVRFWDREVIENLDGVCETILNLLQGAPADLDQPAPRASL